MKNENLFNYSVDDEEHYSTSPQNSSLNYDKNNDEQSEGSSGIDWDKIVEECNKREAEEIAKLTPFEKYQYDRLCNGEPISIAEEYERPLRMFWCGLTLLPKPHNSLFINFDKYFVSELKNLSCEHNSGKPFEKIYFYKFADKLTISPFEPKFLSDDAIIKSNTIQFAGRNYCQMRVPIPTYFRNEFNIEQYSKVGLLAEFGEGHYRCDFLPQYKRVQYKNAWGLID